VATDLDVYLPFDGVDAFEAEWRDMFGSWLVDGVIAGLLNELEVYADSSGRQVKVKSGVVRINGEHGKSTAEKTIAVTTNASGSSRIDRLVAVVDYTANKIQFDVVAGTPGSGSPPALTDNASIRQVSLAQIGPLASGYTTIAAGAVTDERAFISSHGVAFANTAARDLWVPAPAKGFEAFDRSTLKRAAFDGSAWRVVEALGAWDTYNPATNGSGFTLGNGTLVGRYRQIGRMCDFIVQLTKGSTTSFSPPVKFGLPLARAANTFDVGIVNAHRASADANIGGTWYSGETNNTTRITFGDQDATWPGATGGYLDSNTPLAWAAGDILTIRGSYETA
jgi:hypothetical protein